MKILFQATLVAPLLLTLLCMFFLQADSQGAKQTELELTIRIVEDKYCSGASMLLILKEEFKNVGQHNIILSKYAQPPFQYRISKDIGAARAKRYESVVTPMLGGGSVPPEFGEEPPSEYFIILEPGQSYTSPNTIVIPISITETDTEKSKDYLRPGEHVLELYTSTWPFRTGREAELRVRWERFGKLWTENVFSLPMTFHVAKSAERSLSNCNSAQRN